MKRTHYYNRFGHWHAMPDAVSDKWLPALDPLCTDLLQLIIRRTLGSRGKEDGTNIRIEWLAERTGHHRRNVRRHLHDHLEEQHNLIEITERRDPDTDQQLPSFYAVNWQVLEAGSQTQRDKKTLPPQDLPSPQGHQRQGAGAGEPLDRGTEALRSASQRPPFNRHTDRKDTSSRKTISGRDSLADRQPGGDSRQAWQRPSVDVNDPDPVALLEDLIAYRPKAVPAKARRMAEREIADYGAPHVRRRLDHYRYRLACAKTPAHADKYLSAVFEADNYRPPPAFASGQVDHRTAAYVGAWERVYAARYRPRRLVGAEWRAMHRLLNRDPDFGVPLLNRVLAFVFSDPARHYRNAPWQRNGKPDVRQIEKNYLKVIGWGAEHDRYLSDAYKLLGETPDNPDYEPPPEREPLLPGRVVEE